MLPLLLLPSAPRRAYSVTARMRLKQQKSLRLAYSVTASATLTSVTSGAVAKLILDPLPQSHVDVYFHSLTQVV